VENLQNDGQFESALVCPLDLTIEVRPIPDGLPAFHVCPGDREVSDREVVRAEILVAVSEERIGLQGNTRCDEGTVG
jgi:hypothetical protein